MTNKKRQWHGSNQKTTLSMQQAMHTSRGAQLKVRELSVIGNTAVVLSNTSSFAQINRFRVLEMVRGKTLDFFSRIKKVQNIQGISTHYVQEHYDAQSQSIQGPTVGLAP